MYLSQALVCYLRNLAVQSSLAPIRRHRIHDHLLLIGQLLGEAILEEQNAGERPQDVYVFRRDNGRRI